MFDRWRRFYTIENAMLFPVEGPSHPKLRGGLEAPGMPRRFQYQRGGKVQLPEISAQQREVEPDFFDGNLVYGGPYSSHFGHMIAEYSHRFWAGEVLNRHKPRFVICGKVNDDYLAPFATGVLDYFGIDNPVVVTKPMRVRKLTVPQSGGQLSAKQLSWYKHHLAAAAKRAGVLNRTDQPDKVAILRAHLPLRRLVGEDLLEKFLEDEGYHLYRPENHNLVDQLKVIANAKSLIIADGSPGHLFDLLPYVGGDVFVYGRDRASRISENSIVPKVARLHEFKHMIRFQAPNLDQAQPRRSLGLFYCPLSLLTADMKQKGFVSRTLQDAPADIVKRDAQRMINTQLLGAEASQDINALVASELMRAHYTTAKKFFALKSRLPKQRWRAFKARFL